MSRAFVNVDGRCVRREIDPVQGGVVTANESRQVAFLELAQLDNGRIRHEQLQQEILRGILPVGINRHVLVVGVADRAGSGRPRDSGIHGSGVVVGGETEIRARGRSRVGSLGHRALAFAVDGDSLDRDGGEEFGNDNRRGILRAFSRRRAAVGGVMQRGSGRPADGYFTGVAVQRDRRRVDEDNVFGDHVAVVLPVCHQHGFHRDVAADLERAGEKRGLVGRGAAVEGVVDAGVIRQIRYCEPNLGVKSGYFSYLSARVLHDAVNERHSVRFRIKGHRRRNRLLLAELVAADRRWYISFGKSSRFQRFHAAVEWEIDHFGHVGRIESRIRTVIRVMNLAFRRSECIEKLSEKTGGTVAKVCRRQLHTMELTHDRLALHVHIHIDNLRVNVHRGVIRNRERTSVYRPVSEIAEFVVDDPSLLAVSINIGIRHRNRAVVPVKFDLRCLDCVVGREHSFQRVDHPVLDADKAISPVSGKRKRILVLYPVDMRHTAVEGVPDFGTFRGASGNDVGAVKGDFRRGHDGDIVQAPKVAGTRHLVQIDHR